MGADMDGGWPQTSSRAGGWRTTVRGSQQEAPPTSLPKLGHLPQCLCRGASPLPTAFSPSPVYAVVSWVHTPGPNPQGS